MFFPKSRFHWFSVLVIVYMIAGICWWSWLLYTENQKVYNLHEQIRSFEESPNQAYLSDYQNRKHMIIGEGIVLIAALVTGVWIINRSAVKEIRTARLHTDFLLSVSHELKSPITALKLALQTLTNPRLNKESSTEIHANAREDIERLDSLVDNILFSAHLDHQKLELYRENLKIGELLKSVLKRSNRFKDRLMLSYDANISEKTIYIDRQNIEMCLDNILSNAFNYSDNDSPVELGIELLEKTVKFKISDRGPGISENDKSHIFNKFFRGSGSSVRSKKGTGLGLYIASEIAKAHKGKIFHQVREGGGSHFILEIAV